MRKILILGVVLLILAGALFVDGQRNAVGRYELRFRKQRLVLVFSGLRGYFPPQDVEGEE